MIEDMMPQFAFEPPPPEIMAQLKAQQEAADDISRAEARMYLENHRRMCQWAAIMCVCDRVYQSHDPHRHHSYGDCPVHGNFLLINSEFL